jgi:large subunit ribosomal protein L24
VVVEGVNMVTKHARPRGRATRAQQLQTGRIEQPGAVSLANVMLVCPRCDRPTRVRRGELEGKSVRLCRRCGEPVDRIR